MIRDLSPAGGVMLGLFLAAMIWAAIIILIC